MKLKIKVLLMVAFLVLAIPLAIPLTIPTIAGAAPVGTFSSDLSPSQTFYGDGAVYGNGYLQAPPANNKGDKCLQCHQGTAADFDPNVIIPDMSSYLRTGHGNMLKKVTAPPQVWKGADGLPHSTTSEGHVINWTTGKVDLGGFCDVGGFSGQFGKTVCEATTACTLDASNYPAAYTSSTCLTAGGQWRKGKWTAASRLTDITYFVGDWMTGDAPDTGITGAGLPANKFFMADGRTYGTCGSCHNTAYKANDYTRLQPFADNPNFPKSSAAGVGGSWVLNGIQCERCHDATKHYASPYTATVPKGAASTALCSQCHIRPAAYEGSANPNAATQPTAYPIGASATNFGGHLIGKQVLNSPHGLFTGSYSQIATTTGGLYNSRFSDGTCNVAGEFLDKASCEAAGGTWTSSQGGCTTCHNVHQSTVPDARATFGSQPFKRECGIACHSDKGDLSTLRHPRGHGTPQEEGEHDVGLACASCHMPKPAGGTGLSVHVFRINTDPAYSTFPAVGATTPGICSDPSYKTQTACTAAGKSWSLVANSAPDGTWTNAVWVDLDLACGKCHGTGGEAKSLSKNQLAKYAKGIHGVSQNTNTAPTAAMTALPTVTGYTVSFKDNSIDIEDPQSALRIAVNWGDWTISTGLPGSTFTHTYNSGGTFTIRHTAADTQGLKGYESVSVIVSGE